jgi:hypothetical protein
MPESDLLKAALDYAAAGIPVFHCEPDGKAPATVQGFRDATTNPGQITCWWGGGERYNIGLRPADAGWIVLDADLNKRIDPELLARLPETFTVETPRGGKHFYFETPAEHGNTAFDQHIDVRSANGYVLAPESIVNGKSYRVISNCGRLAQFPDWAEERLALRTRCNSNEVSVGGNKRFDWDTPSKDLEFYPVLPATVKRLLDKPGDRSAVCFDFLKFCKRCGYSQKQLFELCKAHCDEPAFGHYREHPAGFEASLRSDIERAFTKTVLPQQRKTPEKRKNRFGGLSPSEGAGLPALTYWDDNQTLPRSNMGGCVGFLVGQYGSHKTGTAIMLGLDAIEQHGARVLFIAAEDANGVAKTRLPAACKARRKQLAEIDPYWRTETETFDLLSDGDRAALIEAYREFGPDLIFIDVLTRVVTADINAPETGMRVMQSAYGLAAPFGATVVIAHHPGLNGGGRPMGSSLFTSLADFSLKAGHKDGVVSTHVDKMKNGPDGFTVRYKTELVAFDTDDMGLAIEAPVVRAMSAKELEERKAKRPPKPDVAAENATDAAAIAKLERDAPDVLEALRKITKPTLLREIAPMLQATEDGADAKDEEKGTPFASRIRRLTRLIGTPQAPGILAPFTAPRTGGKTSPHRLMPVAPSTLEHELPAENEPSDAPAS